MDVSVDFIFDDVRRLNPKHKVRYPLTVYGDPVIESQSERVVDYINVWPCKGDRITIKVECKYSDPSKTFFG